MFFTIIVRGAHLQIWCNCFAFGRVVLLHLFDGLGGSSRWLHIFDRNSESGIHAMSSRAYGNQRQDYVRLGPAPAIVSSIRNTELVTATRVTCNNSDHGIVETGIEDAFCVAVQLRDYHSHLWVDGKKTGPWGRSGTFTFFDFRQSFVGDCLTPFDCVGFHIPRSAMKLLDEDLQGKKIDTLDLPPGSDVDDNTVFGLTQALLPGFADPVSASGLFMDTIGLALCIHVGTIYGGVRPLGDVHPGGLARWQLNRAMEMIDANLDSDLSLMDIAAACGLSAGYFARAFKLAVGMPPYRWMLRRRAERALELMKDRNLSLGDIASACGYSDQTHFNRSFAKAMGTSPGTWRKTLRC